VYAILFCLDSGAEVEYKPLPTGPNGATKKDTKVHKVPLIAILQLSQRNLNCVPSNYKVKFLSLNLHLINVTMWGNLQVTVIENVYWKEFGLLAFVWVSFIAVQIAKVCFFITINGKY